MNPTAKIIPIQSRWRAALPAPIRHDLVRIHHLLTMSFEHDGENVPLEELERVVLVAMEHGVVEAIERELAVADMEESDKDLLFDHLQEVMVVRGADGFMSIVALVFVTLTEIRMYYEYDSLSEGAMAHAACRAMMHWGLMCTPGLHISPEDHGPDLYLLGSEW